MKLGNMTVKEAIDICKVSHCSFNCPIKNLCKFTIIDKATLEEQYNLMLYPDDKPVKEVVEEIMKSLEITLEGLRKLEF